VSRHKIKKNIFCKLVFGKLFRKLVKIMSLKRITGPGGVLIKAKDARALAAWYQENIGIGFNNNS